MSACGPASPYVIDQPQPDEMKPGPGLFSKKYGKDGEIYLIGRPETKAEEERDRADRQRRRLAGNPRVPVTTATAPYNPPPAYNRPSAYGQPYAAAPTFRPLTPPAASYSVHFASYASADLAQRGWSQIWNRHAQMLAGIQPYIDYGSLGGGRSGYHLFGKGLSRQRADTICRSLRSRNESCTVVAF
ncbi:MAG: hypothetical protein IH904_04030 [Proteobacteria bacterium]|nr:hypothetical protein [Pseudomonadota bacterium]